MASRRAGGRVSLPGTVFGLTPPVSFFGTRRKPMRLGTLISLGGSSQVVHYLMLARRVSDGNWIKWEVTTTPDSSGAHAPSEVITDTITTVRRWTT